MSKLRRLDLNLLVILQYLLEERSISAVACRLNLSQPAVSNALRRLRVALNDELFVRTAQGMQPTPTAERLAGPLGEALSLVSDVLEYRDAFQPETSNRRFTVALSDVGEIHFMPRLIKHCADLAPGVLLDSVRLSGSDLVREMEAGRVDMAVGAFEGLGAGIFQRMLFRQDYCALCRADHPLLSSLVERKSFTAARHAIVLQAPQYARINQVLERAGVDLTQQYTVPHFAPLPYIVAETDLIAIVPEFLAREVAPRFKLATFVPPVKMPQLQTNLSWPRRYHRDAANLWLRDQIVNLFGQK